jgi:hypothetical protein
VKQHIKRGISEVKQISLGEPSFLSLLARALIQNLLKKKSPIYGFFENMMRRIVWNVEQMMISIDFLICRDLDADSMPFLELSHLMQHTCASWPSLWMTSENNFNTCSVVLPSADDELFAFQRRARRDEKGFTFTYASPIRQWQEWNQMVISNGRIEFVFLLQVHYFVSMSDREKR